MRIDNCGRRTAAGLPGCAAKYNSARSCAAIASKTPLCFIVCSFAQVFETAQRNSSLNLLGKPDDRLLGKNPILRAANASSLLSRAVCHETRSVAVLCAADFIPLGTPRPNDR